MEIFMIGFIVVCLIGLIVGAAYIRLTSNKIELEPVKVERTVRSNPAVGAPYGVNPVVLTPPPMRRGDRSFEDVPAREVPRRRKSDAVAVTPTTPRQTNDDGFLDGMLLGGTLGYLLGDDDPVKEDEPAKDEPKRESTPLEFPAEKHTPVESYSPPVVDTSSTIDYSSSRDDSGWSSRSDDSGWSSSSSDSSSSSNDY